MTSRRAVLSALAVAALAAFPGAAGLRAAIGRRRQGRHPEPRPGIDARGVMTAEQLAGYGASVVAVFDMVREIPQIADGIHCYCGCDGRMANMRSLLSCFSAEGMGRDCEICQGEARMAHRRFREGQSLAQIRRAIDSRYG